MRKGISDVRYRRMLAVLIDARRRAGLTQGEVAERLSRPQQFVSRYELGERRLDVFEFIDVTKALDLDGVAELKNLITKEAGE